MGSRFSYPAHMRCMTGWGALAVLMGVLAGCAQTELRGMGGRCVRSDQCEPLLACVGGVCTTDLSGLEGGVVPSMDSGQPPMDGAVLDAAPPADTGPPMDSGPPVDTGMPMDTGVPDTGVPDSGVPDSGIPDTGVPDTGVPDTGIPLPDAGPLLDSGP